MNKIERFFTRIRIGVFETNSSSCHTVTIEKNRAGVNFNQLENIDPDDNLLHINLETFGWGYEEIHDATRKLAYYICMIISTMNLWEDSWSATNSKDENFWYQRSKLLYNSYEFKEVENLIKERVSECDGIKIDNLYETRYNMGSKGKKPTTYYDYEYGIDHQSCEDYSNAHEFLDEHEISLEDFIFDPSVVLVIDNDNR